MSFGYMADLLSAQGVEEETGTPGWEIEGPHLDFRQYVNIASNRTYRWYRHCELIAEVLQGVVDGHLSRVMIFVPYRHGKSELFSRHLPGYYLVRWPGRWVGLASYAAELAYNLSRNAQEFFLNAGGHLKSDETSVKQWRTEDGGGMWAAGVGGPMTGKGYHLGIIDDPLKNAEEASSALIRAKQDEWYRSTFYTRAEPGGAIVIGMTRWHEEDVSGLLLKREEALLHDNESQLVVDEEAEGWHIVALEGIKEEKPYPIPETCTIEADWREPGEALCPERYPLRVLTKAKRNLGPKFFASMIQQRPVPDEGLIYGGAQWNFYDDDPMELIRSLRDLIFSWDMTFKGKSKISSRSYVVGQLWGRAKTTPRRYLLAQWRARLGFKDTRDLVESTAKEWRGLGRVGALLVEDKANGPAIIDSLKEVVAGLVAVEPDGTKEERAEATSYSIISGNVWLPRNAPWVEEFISEHRAFPQGSHDDQVDAQTQAMHHYDELDRKRVVWSGEQIGSKQSIWRGI
jgi:predicted phage terminase large subunit-like protein